METLWKEERLLARDVLVTNAIMWLLIVYSFYCFLTASAVAMFVAMCFSSALAAFGLQFGLQFSQPAAATASAEAV